MKTKLLLSSLVFFLAAAVFLPQVLAYRSEIFAVILETEAAYPKITKIKRGQTIVFENRRDTPAWPELIPNFKNLSSAGPIKEILPGEKWGFTFDKTGVWNLRDRLNEKIAGEVKVVDFDGETPSRPPKNLKQDETSFLTRAGRALSNFFHKLFFLITPGRDDGSYENSVSIAANDTALRRYIEKFGGGTTLSRLDKILPGEACHDRAHLAGEMAYAIYEDEAFQWHAFAFDSQCNTGYFHGLLESYLKSGKEHYALKSPITDYGKENILKNIKSICEESSFDLKCTHVLGHSVMAWSKYQLFDALAVCDEVSQEKFIREECWRGVFMENADGGFSEETGHLTSYLNDDDVLYPCNAVPEKYQDACYQFIPGNIDRAFRENPQKAAEACLKMPFPHDRSCFSNIGFFSMRDYVDNPRKVAESCEFSPEGVMREMCIVGAAREAAYNPQKRKTVFEFCELFTEKSERDSCYQAAFSNAKLAIEGKRKWQSFCSWAALPEIKEKCLNF